MTTSLDNTDQLLELQAAFSLLVDTRGPELEYRIHYDSTGHITGCSQTGTQDSGTYLVVTKEEYDNYYRYEAVKDNKLISKQPPSTNRRAIAKNEYGWRVVEGHANIVLEDNETYTSTDTYGYRSN
jgi:hypothetical protein